MRCNSKNNLLHKKQVDYTEIFICSRHMWNRKCNTGQLQCQSVGMSATTFDSFYRSNGGNALEQNFHRINGFSRETTIRSKECAVQLKLYPFSSIKMCAQQKKKKTMEQNDAYTESISYWDWMWDVTYHILFSKPKWCCLIKSQISKLF